MIKHMSKIFKNIYILYKKSHRFIKRIVFKYNVRINAIINVVIEKITDVFVISENQCVFYQFATGNQSKTKSVKVFFFSNLKVIAFKFYQSIVI
jgi:hypothetical protein